MVGLSTNISQSSIPRTAAKISSATSSGVRSALTITTLSRPSRRRKASK